MLKFKRIESGVYQTVDGRYRVEKDIIGPVSDEEREGDGLLAGCDDDGWAAIYPNDDLTWWNYKREAVAECNRHAEREARRLERQEQESLEAGHDLMNSHPEVWQ